MYNPYGNSGYQSSRSSHSSSTRSLHSAKLEKPKSAKKRKNWTRKLAIWLGLFVALSLILTWFFLGAFRFMMFRYASFTGFPFGSRDYIVLFQNNNELRPSGGFISTYGVLEFSHGVYSGLEFKDIYGDIDEHPYIEPPLIISALSASDSEGYTLRDANFDPDFNIAADKIIEFYEMANPDAKIDGVIAVDFTFFEQILDRYSSIYSNGYELTEDNFFEIIATLNANNVRSNSASGSSNADKSELTPQELLSPLVNKTVSRSLILPWRIKGMLNLIEKGFEEKHILASFERSGMAKSFLKRNWDGVMPQSDAGDFLAINAANYTGLSSDRYILRDVQYELDVTDSKDVLGNPVIEAQVKVTVSHEGTWNSPLSGAYSGYLRTMIPLGSEVVLGGSVAEDRVDSEVLGELLELEPGESITYTYAYELPEYVWVDGVYYLHLHKQPGTIADHYRVIVRTPEGTTLETGDFAVKENTGVYETNLFTDINLSFNLIDYENPVDIYIEPLSETPEPVETVEPTEATETTEPLSESTEPITDNENPSL